MRRTKEDAAETARQIQQAAEDLFLEKGYENVSLEEIAAAAGVTRGAVHWHFKNKQGLLLALKERAREPFRKLADRISCTGERVSLQELGDLIGDAFMRLQSEPRLRGLLRVMIHLDLAMAEESCGKGKAFSDEMYEILLRIFTAVEKDPGLPPGWTAPAAALMVRVAMDGFVKEWALADETFCIFADGQKFIRMILNNLTVAR